MASTKNNSLVKHSSDPKALRISTVEAVALLLSELKEDSVVTDALIEAVKVNNQALIHSLSVRPKNALPESKEKSTFTIITQSSIQ